MIQSLAEATQSCPDVVLPQLVHFGSNVNTCLLKRAKGLNQLLGLWLVEPLDSQC